MYLCISVYIAFSLSMYIALYISMYLHLSVANSMCSMKNVYSLISINLFDRKTPYFRVVLILLIKHQRENVNN